MGVSHRGLGLEVCLSCVEWENDTQEQGHGKARRVDLSRADILCIPGTSVGTDG